VWDVDATTNAISELGEHLAGERIEKGHAGIHIRLLADLVLPAGAGKPEVSDLLCKQWLPM
jgi:hypothetical protein